jgi:Domain of Unknown Function (DUF928)
MNKNKFTYEVAKSSPFGGVRGGRWGFVMLLFFSVVTHAQVIITPQLPAIGLYLKNQLWSVSVLNNGTATKNVRLKIQFSDVSNNQLVFTATSKLFVMAPGLTLVQYNTVLPVTYNVINSSYGVDGNPDGFLPVGVFNICYIVVEDDGETPTEMAEECAAVEIEPLSPPLLVFPEQEARISERRPVFNWLAPSPGGLLSSLNYRLVLVEVLPAQSASDAIQQNLPLLTQQNIIANSLPFPAAYPQLDTGKTYAWQVAALTNQNIVSRSEVWTFKVQYSYADSSIKTGSRNYISLTRTQEGASSVCYGTVYYQYTNEINDTTVTLKCFDISKENNQLLLLQETPVPVKFGVNYLTVDLSGVNGIRDKQFYLLELINSKKESWFVKVEYRR